MSVLDDRQLGVLLHPSSLPGRFGIGDLGPAARRFVDWLAAAGARLWQILPLCPPGPPDGVNPYVSRAALEGNPALVSLEDLAAEGLLTADELAWARYPEGVVDKAHALAAKRERLDRAAARVVASAALRAELERFRAASPWAEEGALFEAIAAQQRNWGWWHWPEPLRDRDPAALARARVELAADITRRVVHTWLFERQWRALRVYAAARGVRVLGDLAIYVPQQSVDVWAHRDGFQLDPDGNLLARSGCPPDAFAAEGQLWGGPLYAWERMAADGYAWWIARMRRAFEQADVVRIDHFRAFAAYWSIPREATTARDGQWRPGPGRAFFDAMERALGPRPICVEDLGTIDDAVLALRDALGHPGMKILHYAFDGDPRNPYLPHNHPENAIVYPGNHDNDTTVGWFRRLPDHARSHVQHYLGRHGDDIAWDLVRTALASVARVAIVPMQDVLALDSRARMNDPEGYAGPPEAWTNWTWRLQPGAATGDHARRLAFLGRLYGRC